MAFNFSTQNFSGFTSILLSFLNKGRTFAWPGFAGTKCRGPGRARRISGGSQLRQLFEYVYPDSFAGVTAAFRVVVCECPDHFSSGRGNTGTVDRRNPDGQLQCCGHSCLELGTGSRRLADCFLCLPYAQEKTVGTFKNIVNIQILRVLSGCCTHRTDRPI